ncbi:ATP-binding protein [Paenibacillus silviterrae]|uniref:ATP-binding protein n=1 Tax=Paenibacillus silviterrae TaxID=3242194 RepID=UPI002543F7ED|nr:ATP-binding protein [Paenibacillus chinjuensis]
MKTDNNREETNHRLATIGQISAGIAHEIRNPLTAVKGFMQLLQKEHDSRYWDIINTELDQAINTVQNLLTVAKPNLVEERESYISVCVLVENTLSLFQNEMYRVQVEKKFHNTSAKIRGKSNQLKRAFFNLIKNAFEAIDGDGRICLEHYEKEGFVHFIIRDTGKGIPKEKLGLLGTPFFTTKGDVGNGLGLAQVYATFHEHGGQVLVDSTEGIGTEFTLRLPVSTPDLGEQFTMTELKLADDVQQFFELNREAFNRQLELAASNTFQVVSQSKLVSAKDLLDHANQILNLIHKGLTQEIIQLAQERGIAWAKSDIPIISKMEWFYSLRKVMWSFLRYYHVNKNISAIEVFELSDRISEALDNFIIHFNVSFTKYRDETLRTQRQIIDELTVPLIPILSQVAVLPLIGTLDEERLTKIEDRVFAEVEYKSIQKIVIDLSGALIFEPEAIGHLVRIHDGLTLLGCTVILTGIKASLTKLMLNCKVEIGNKFKIESTLQQAIYKELHPL